MRALLMHNPTAGEGDDPTPAIRDALKEAGYEPLYFSTDEKDYKKAVKEEEADLIAIVGGDGTVSKVLRRVADRSVPIAIFPAGTANNVARSLGIEGSVEEVASGIAHAPTVPLDIGIATGPWGQRHFLEGIGFGAFAKHMSDSADGETREETLANARRMLCDYIAEGEPEWFEIDIDGHTLTGDFIFVEVINIESSGPALTLSPDAKSGDRLLDVVYLPAADRDAMISWLRQEDTDQPIPLKSVQGKRVAVTTEGATLRRDDKVMLEPEKAQIIRISLEDDQFRVLKPGA